MTRFSQRVGARPPFTSGLEEASPRLRIELWNLLHERLLPDEDSKSPLFKMNSRRLWNYFGWAIDDIPDNAYAARRNLKNNWQAWPWPEFYDAVEFSASLLLPGNGRDPTWFETLNAVLERNGCAYRFVGRELAPITNPTELAEVQRAIESPINSIAVHIGEALSLLPPNPDSSPRNSVKESISAIEAALKHLTGRTSATLGDGLKHYEKQFGDLHPSIRRGLEQFYAYTNGPEGMRHALIEESREVTVDDARFMVVTCSAFANYLVAIAASRSRN